MWAAVRAWVRRLAGDGDDIRALGRRGERVAARHLRRAGYRIVARNAKIAGVVRGGVAAEADLIALAPDRRTIVIVEVKSRRKAAIAPEAQLNAEKRRRLRMLAERLIRANGWSDRPVRIDAVAVEFEGRAFEVRHWQGIA